MNELRWILVGIGIVLLALIYFFSRRSSSDDEELSPVEPRYEPSLTLDDSVDEIGQEAEAGSSFDYQPEDEEPAISPTSASRFETSDSERVHSEPPILATPEPVPAMEPEPIVAEPNTPEPSPETAPNPVVPEKVIALHLMPKAGQMFEGVEFIGALQAEGLKFGRFDIFHRFTDPDTATDSTQSQFSLANMIKPGTFSLYDLESQQFKGASMFLVLPGPEDAVAAFADMVATGRRLAATLEGQLLDAQGTPLSRQSASHLREDIINYQHGLSAAPAE